MHDSNAFVLITTLVTAFGLALIFGYLAERFLKTPALVGYTIAGVAVNLIPGLPVVDAEVTHEFAELGVMLLMFGVGLHFSLADLVKVKGVAVTGALIQMTISSIGGSLLATLAWDWTLPQAIAFGLTLSCASTVVVMKALEIRHFTTGAHGQVVIGWLIVQDLVAVFLMVCMPVMAQVMMGAGELNAKQVLVDLSTTFLGVVIFVVIMLVVGKRLFPFVLRKVAELGSRDLFTLCVLAIAIGIAYGAGVIFHVSYALGAFFAGMVMRESSYAHRAAVNSLPIQDAFSVLFFVSVGLMLDWHVFIEQPLAILSVLLIILGITSTMSFFLVVLLGWPLETALIVAACMAQIGEFSFILLSQAIQLKMATTSTMSLIVAASIISIAINPILFHFLPRYKFRLITRYPAMRRAAMRSVPMSGAGSMESGKVERPLANHIIVVGFDTTSVGLLHSLKLKRLPTLVMVSPEAHIPNEKTCNDLGVSLMVGNPEEPMAWIHARLPLAKIVVLAGEDMFYNRAILKMIRQIAPEKQVLVRIRHEDDLGEIPATPETTVVCDSLATIDGIGREIEAVMGGRKVAKAQSSELEQSPVEAEPKEPTQLDKAKARTIALGSQAATLGSKAAKAVGAQAVDVGHNMWDRFKTWRASRQKTDDDLQNKND